MQDLKERIAEVMGLSARDLALLPNKMKQIITEQGRLLDVALAALALVSSRCTPEVQLVVDKALALAEKWMEGK